MCCGERLAEARDRATQPDAFLIQLREPRFQLVRHVVEGGAEHRELIPAVHGDALGESALGDPVGGLGKRAERADDRAAFEVRDEGDECERHEETEQQAVP